MIEIRVERTIDRPIDVVFDRLAAVDHYDDWLPPSMIFVDSRLSEDGAQIGPGTEFYDSTRFGQLLGKITEYDPPTRISFLQRLRWGGVDVFESRPAYTLTSRNDQTHVVHEGVGRFFGVFRVLDPIGRLMADRERSRVVDALKQSLEG